MADTNELQKFYDKCKYFDWFYEMSDDHSVWQRGKAAQASLVSEARSSTEKLKIYEAWKAHRYSGKPWGTEQAPRPERPQ